MLGHIVTKEQDAVGVSFRRSGPASKETYMYTVDEIKDDQCILWMIFDIRHEQLFTVNDLWKCQSTLEEEKAISKYLCDEMLYIGQINGCQKIINIYAKHASKVDMGKMNAVTKALEASSMKALRIFRDASLEPLPPPLPLNSSVPITTGFSVVFGRIKDNYSTNSAGTRTCTY